MSGRGAALVHSARQEPALDEAVASRSASAVVADALREGILRQTLRGGERLRQDATAARFGVSQMIVREAFRQLQTEGFLHAEPRRGMSVAVMTADEADEMTRLRSSIEALALEWAIPRMSNAEADKAGRLLSELDRAKATNRIITLNAQFHETLYAPAGKARTLALIGTLRLNFERYLRFTWEETQHREQSQREHRVILEHCRRKDAKSACEALRHHIQATGAVLVERLRARLG